jgi:murein DD-endopeptidase MepM/ murein hydrolase activator NlpD
MKNVTETKGAFAAADFGRPAPNVVRLMLVCGIFAYFPLASVHLRPFVASRLSAAGFAVKSLLFPATAAMGGMETQYAATDGDDFYPQKVAYTTQEIPDTLEAALDDGVLEPEELSAATPLLFFAHHLERGDMIGNLAIKYGLSQDTLISVNGINNTRSIQAGAALKIPNQDGVMHKVAAGETIHAIAEKYEVRPGPIVTANELFSEKVLAGSTIFVPGGKMNEMMLQEINGDLFIRPVRGRITSLYGWRISPISGRRSFHSGLDIAAPSGTPIGAGMSGRVTSVGYSAVFGNYVIISHHSNYRTLYAHLSSVKTRSGSYVSTGQTIGYVGNTGQSTGPHLHFQVYKSGVTVNPNMLMR